MRRDQLEHAIRTACQIIGRPEVIIVGRLADDIEGVAGELSPFEEMHGFSIDGVDLDTSALPAGWGDRLVKVQHEHNSRRRPTRLHRLVPRRRIRAR